MPCLFKGDADSDYGSAAIYCLDEATCKDNLILSPRKEHVCEIGKTKAEADNSGLDIHTIVLRHFVTYYFSIVIKNQ